MNLNIAGALTNAMAASAATAKRMLVLQFTDFIGLANAALVGGFSKTTPEQLCSIIYRKIEQANATSFGATEIENSSRQTSDNEKPDIYSSTSKPLAESASTMAKGEQRISSPFALTPAQIETERALLETYRRGLEILGYEVRNRAGTWIVKDLKGNKSTFLYPNQFSQYAQSKIFIPLPPQTPPV